MPTRGPAIDFSKPIPIFPLPHTVLLPRAIQPLHLFEPRYRDMAAHALRDTGLIAMALLKPGYQERYYTHNASIYPVVCIGRVVRHERLSDGRYNLLLQGLQRATIEREDRRRSYRRGWLRPLDDHNDDLSRDDTDEAVAARAQLAAALDADTLAAISPSGVLLDVVCADDLPFSDVVDLLAFNLVDDATFRQAFLNEPSARVRAAWIVKLLGEIKARMNADANRDPATGAQALRPVTFSIRPSSN